MQFSSGYSVRMVLFYGDVEIAIHFSQPCSTHLFTCQQRCYFLVSLIDFVCSLWFCKIAPKFFLFLLQGIHVHLLGSSIFLATRKPSTPRHTFHCIFLQLCIYRWNKKSITLCCLFTKYNV